MEKATEKTKKDGGKGKIILAIIATLILAAGAIIGIFFVWRNAQYITTDNARITTTLISVAPTIPGILERWTVSEGRFVEQNEILGWVENDEVMRSPVAGLVISTDVVQNQLVSPMSPIAVIADTSKIHIQANIEEDYIQRIQLGQAVSITIDPFGGRQFRGYISEIGKITAAELSGQALFFNTGGTFTRITHLIPVKINISDDVNLGSLIGVNARVRISQRKFENFIAESQRRPQNNAAKISVRGIVESVESRNIYSELPNRIVSVNVVEGDRVEQGQVLAALNSEDLNIQRASAAAALRMAEIDSARAQHNHDNTRALYGRGIARDELRQAEFTLQSKTAAKNLAQTQLDAINATLRRTSIRSPMDGTITSVIAKVGEIAVSRLFTVENTENLRIIARFREQDLPKISVGTTVSITTDANPDKVYSGKITRINPAATAQSPVPEFETEIQVVSENSDLRIGMNVRVVVDL